jgi:hypothetical protein
MIPSELPIYIELQNISDSVFSIHKKNLPPQVNTLPFLKELYYICEGNIKEHITNFDVKDVKIDSGVEIQYILTFLKCLDNESDKEHV